METVFKNISIFGISTVVPENVLKLETLSSVYGLEDVRKIIATTGIKEVRIADNETTASDLCYQAAQHMIEYMDIVKDQIDGLIFVSQTNDYSLPQTSNVLQSRLGLNENVFCLDIRLGCSGYIVGLFQASLLINSGACKNVLVLAGDTTSKIINPKDKSLRMVFGDAGSATFVTRGSDDIGFKIHNKGSEFSQLIVPAGGFRKPFSNLTSNEIMDQDGNVRSENDLYMNGTEIFNFAINKVPTLIDGLLETAKWSKTDVDLFLFHQANNFMVEYLRRKMKIISEKVPLGVETYGNTGPCSIPLLLSHISEQQITSEKVIMCGFGVGLSWAGCYTNLAKTKIFKTIDYIKD
jgi:3-oxoacyl-[acyl-carrier-protein] synthase-3